MSPSLELQTLIYTTLRDDYRLIPEVAGRVYDRVPRSSTGAVTAAHPYISFGPHDYTPEDTDCITSGEHTFQIDVWSRAVGSPECKRIADIVKKVLHNADLELDVNAICEPVVDSVRFVRDPDGLTSRAILSLRVSVEEA